MKQKYFIFIILIFVTTVLSAHETILTKRIGGVELNTTSELQIGNPFIIEEQSFGLGEYYVSRSLVFRLYKEGSTGIGETIKTCTITLRVDGNVTPIVLEIQNTTNTEQIFELPLQDIVLSTREVHDIEIISFSNPQEMQNVYLEYGIKQIRYISAQLLSIPQLHPITSDRIISWTADENAEGYELEWVYIDKYRENYSDIDVTNAFSETTNKEPVSITVLSNWYELHSKYPEGKIFYRVRPYTKVYTNNGVTKEFWFKDSWSPVIMEEINQTESEINHNWTRQTSFAEEGMQKTVIQYYDGALKQRQGLTSLSSEDITIIGESYYDLAGRSALQVMPYPERGIQYLYHPVTNKIEESHAINPSDFAGKTDLHLSTSTGAAEYYEGEATEFLTNPYYAFTPKAEGYVASQIEYTADNTGRVLTQSSVGKTFSKGNNHDVAMFYETPTRTELHRMFGSQVGYTNLYEKSISVDANGQQQVTYTDKEKRVIATALRGRSPDNLTPIIDFSNAQVHFDISDNSTVVNNVLTTTHTIAQGSRANEIYTFSYDFTGATAQFASQRIGAIPEEQCFYDLKIYVTDKRGNIMPFYSAPTYDGGNNCEYGILENGKYTSIQASNISLMDKVSFTLELPQGEYSVVKELKLVSSIPLLKENRVLADIYKTNHSQKSLEDVELDLIDQDYSSCEQEVSTPESAMSDYIAMLSTPQETDMCNSLLSQLRNDFNYSYDQDNNQEINGYFFNEKYKSEGAFQDYWQMIYNKSKGIGGADEINFMYYMNSKIEDLGGITDPETLREKLLSNSPQIYPIPLDEYIEDILIKYHPEYCHYESCQDKREFMIYNAQINMVEACPVALADFNPCSTYTGLASDDKACGTSSKIYGLITETFLNTIKTEINNAVLGTNLTDQSAKDKLTWEMFRGKYILEREQLLIENYPYSKVESCGYYNTNYFSAAHVQNPDYGMTQSAMDQKGNQAISEMISPENCKLMFTPPVDQFIVDLENTAREYNSTYTSNLANIADYKEALLEGLAANFCQESIISTTLTPERLTTVHELVPQNIWTILETSKQNAITTFVTRILNDFESRNSFFLTDKTAAINAITGKVNQNYTQYYPIPYISFDDFVALITPFVPIGTNITSIPVADEDNGMIVTEENEYYFPTAFFAQYMNILSEVSQTGKLKAQYNSPYVYTLDVTLLDSYREDFPYDQLYWAQGSWKFENTENKSRLDFKNIFSFANQADVNVIYDKFASILFNPTQNKSMSWNINKQTGVLEIKFEDNNSMTYSIAPGVSSYCQTYSWTGSINNYEGFNLQDNDQNSQIDELCVTLLKKINYPTGISSKELCFGALSDIDMKVVEAGYYPTDFFIQYMNILKELIQKDINSLNYYDRIDLTSLESYSADFPYKNFYIDYGTMFFENNNSLLEIIINIEKSNPLYSKLLETLSSSNEVNNMNWILNKETGSLTYIFYNTQGIEINRYEINDALHTIFYPTPGKSYSCMDIKPYSVDYGDCSNPVQAYIPTEFMTQFLNILQELLLKNPEDLKDYSSPSDANWEASITELNTYDESFPYDKIVVRYGDVSLKSTKGLPIIIFKNLFINSNSSPNSLEVLLYDLLVNRTNNNEQLQWSANNLTGEIQVVILDANGDRISNYGLDVFNLNAKDYTLCYNTTVDPSNFLAKDGVNLTDNQICLSPLKTKMMCQELSDCAPVSNPFEITYDPEVAKQECIKFKYGIYQDQAKQSADDILNKERNRITYQFKKQAFLKGFEENFTYTTTNAEYYYTLYFYDKAGNLVQTISPEGIELVPEANVEYTPTINEDDLLLSILSVDTPPVETDSMRYNYVYTGKEPLHRLPSSYAYNGLNQLTISKVPDQVYPNQFVYNDLGMLRFSKNPNQYNNNGYNFTTYDPLGRITNTGTMSTNVSTCTLLNLRDLANNNSDYRNNNATPEYMVTTYYDTPFNFYYGLPNNFSQNEINTRNRVSYVGISENGQTKQMTYYDYDSHGNVSSILHNYYDLYEQTPFYNSVNYTKGYSTPYKYITYDYDLISNKVTKVTYQKGESDEFNHKYYYDSDNRLRDVYTSANGYIWEHDARYAYYAHGPLARVEYGTHKVQGVDYVYTLQGWLKGVNSAPLTSLVDVGHDHLKETNNVNGNVTPDAFGYMLSYYSKGTLNNGELTVNESDYTPVIGGWNENSFPIITTPNTQFANTPLYNGNIATMTTNLLYDANAIGLVGSYPSGVGTLNKSQMVNYYNYDQLNRIKGVQSYLPFAAYSTSTMAFAEKYSYDLNGNIDTLIRRDKNGTIIDNLIYGYNTDNYGKLENNTLKSVTDLSLNTKGFDQKQGGEYEYDATGNLIRDNIEGLNIDWNSLGKVERVSKQDGSMTIKYGYDAMGNRISKTVKYIQTTQATYEMYVRDASGNIMATYAGVIPNYTSESQINDVQVAIEETYMYGSSRIGVNKNSDRSKINRGALQYELTNHLGNVLVVLTGKKLHDANSNYVPDLVSTQDYSPFGMELEGRTYSESASSKYPVGFQGQVKDDEIYGEGNTYAFKYRMEDARLGRFFSIDPLAAKYPHNSPYAFSENRVVDKIELEGLETAPIPSTQEAMTGTGQAKINMQNSQVVAKQIVVPTGNWIWYNVLADGAMTGSNDGGNTGSFSSGEKYILNGTKNIAIDFLKSKAVEYTLEYIGFTAEMAARGTETLFYIFEPLEAGGGQVPRGSYTVNKYNVIAGSFKDEENAKKFAKQNNGTILPQSDDGFYRVSIYESYSKDNAQTFQENVSDSNTNTWILSTEETISNP